MTFSNFYTGFVKQFKITNAYVDSKIVLIKLFFTSNVYIFNGLVVKALTFKAED